VNGSRILSWASAPLQRLPKHRAAALSLWSPRNPTPGCNTERQLAAPPLRFRPLQRFSSPEQRHELAGYAFPTACAFRFSQPPGAFIRPEPTGLVPCRIRSWGHPPELCSSHAAVRCFQRRSPLGVRTAFRVLLRARVRFPVQLFKLKTGYVALLGLFPSRVFSLSALVRPSPDLPSCGYRLGRKRPNRIHFRVSHAESPACLSRDRRPSWGSWPLGRHARASHTEILESPPKAPGVRRRPLIGPSSNSCASLPEPSITNLSASPPQRLCRSTSSTLVLRRMFVNWIFSRSRSETVGAGGAQRSRLAEGRR
jgi:hypothetical protein